MKQSLLTISTYLLLASCSQKEKVDLLLVNGTVYTVDSSFSTSEAVAVKGGMIVAVGTTADLDAKYKADKTIDLHNRFVYPGFIDAHCHFYGYAMDLDKVNLYGTTSFEAILDTLVSNKERLYNGWLFGRGWDQNDWPVKEFPTNEKLSQLFPDVPVILLRIDGHAALCNAKALELSGVTASSLVMGGEVVLKNGKPTGLLLDNAMELVRSDIPELDVATQCSQVLRAAVDCYANGLTTVDDAGLMYAQVDLLDSLQASGGLALRTYVMLSDSGPNYDRALRQGLYKTERMNVRSFKFYADGALGSRGACLLRPYSDKGGVGFMLSPADYLAKRAALMKEHGFQMCSHCIGDSAVRVLAQIYGQALSGTNDFRWRIEHSQVLDSSDLHFFHDYSIIPSVQTTHATSDMYWADERLGGDRLRFAYAYQWLLSQRGCLALGTDFPVENISPVLTFYAAVFRQDAKGFPDGGFQMENALSRENALRGMTIWAAYSNFEEHEKGSIENGKLADFTILDTDLMKSSSAATLKARVTMTIIGGNVVWQSSE